MAEKTHGKLGDNPVGGQLLESWRALRAAPQPPRPWRDGRGLPWNDPELSPRLLAVHLDQSNHMASRTLDVIRRHVGWLDGILDSAYGDLRKLRILDLGCGPGLYCHELARRGHVGIGVDFAPAAVEHARRTAAATRLDCTFHLADLDDLAGLAPELGEIDAVTFWFGEFNSFPDERAADLLRACAGLLRPGGLLVLEYQPADLFPEDDVQEWRACEESVFSDRPHLWLREDHWDEESRAEITVHWILDAATGRLDRYAQCHRSWTDAELVDLLDDAGFAEPAFHPPITGCDERLEFPVLVAMKV